METRVPLEYGRFYHIYNRGVNGETLFHSDENYCYFLKLYAKHVEPIADTFRYAQAINKRYQRTGALFERPFERKLIDSDRYFQTLVCYIHANPVHHCFVASLHDYPWTSYHTILSSQDTKLKRDEVIAWFQNVENFRYCHQHKQDFETIKAYMIEY